MNIPRPVVILLRFLAALAVAWLAWNWRMHAVQTLSVDYDEDDYIRAAQEYAAVFRSGDLAGLSEFNYRPEHPPLAKILFGASLLTAPEKPLTPDRATTAEPDRFLSRELIAPARTLGAIESTLTVLLLAFINPLAGLFLANHTFTIKYGAQVMLEALPSLTSLLTVLAYLRYKKTNKTAWLALSAAMLGLTAASKYIYCLVGIAILIDWFLDAREQNRLRNSALLALGWGVLAVGIFFAANPYLWTDPLARLQESIFYHAAYSTGASEVESAGFPAWQPFIWLSTSPQSWHPMTFTFAPDLYITILAVLGITRLWKKERMYGIWLVTALLFLLAWPTKWPQYILVLTAPLSLAAAEGAMALFVDPIRSAWKNRQQWKEQWAVSTYSQRELSRARNWLIPGLVAFALLTLFPLVFQLGVSMTDFSVSSIRDGFEGGIWREVWGGLTGQIQPARFGIEERSNTVRYVGIGSFAPVFDYIAGSGILFFNLMWTVVSVSLQTLFGVAVALILWQRGLRLGKFWQALFILPWAIPEMIGAYLWLNIFVWDVGWLALAIRDFGPDIPFGFFNGWQNTAEMRLVVFLIAAVWYGFPFMMLAAGAGLKMIPPDVLDAAKIDGANGWQTLKGVVWPLLRPLLLPAIIIRGIFAFNQFYLFQVFLFGESTLATVSYNVFNPSGWFFRPNGMFALSAVINLIAVIILAGFVFLFNRLSRAGEGVDYA